MASIVSDLKDGYEIISDFLPKHEVQRLQEALELILLPRTTGGVRNIDKKVPSVAALASSELMHNQAVKYLSGTPLLVRAIFFDKTHENNWLVSWHQDRTVAVSERFDLVGWGPWTIKDGTHHVQPPIDVLEQMVTFRIHLDRADATNGCLRVMPGSHAKGLLNPSQIQEYVSGHDPAYCEALAGSALVMRPHLLHASGKTSCPYRRRVLHLEYSSYVLPAGVRWA